jgi:putative transposase
VTCRVLKLHRQNYYRWLESPVTQRDWEDAHLTNAALDAHLEDPNFGYRFIADELEQQGFAVSERRVWRLCSQQHLWSNFAKKKGHSKKAGPPVHDDLVQREFSASAPNELWLTDISEHRTSEGKLYVCCVKDVYSRRIVGYSISDRMTRHVACAALRNAIALRSPDGTTVHSDRGSTISSKFLRSPVEEQWPLWFNGSSGRRGRQRSHGVVPLALAEQRARHQKMGDPGRITSRDRHLDRADLSPSSTSARTRPAHAN